MIGMMDGSNLPPGTVIQKPKSIGLPIPSHELNSREQAAATLADLALDNADMQDAIIEKGGVPKLLALIHEGKTGSVIAQEQAARTLWHLSTDIENQKDVTDSGCIPELTALVRTWHYDKCYWPERVRKLHGRLVPGCSQPNGV